MLKQSSAFLILLIALSCAPKIYKQSFKSGDIWVDTNKQQINAHGGGFLLYNDTYYWFGEVKTSGKDGAKAKVGVSVYASKNLYDWDYKGVALKVTKDTLSKLQIGSIVERPKVIYNKKTNKFVMWFHHELKGQQYKAALTGVAIATDVTGPYEYQDSFRIHAGILPLNLSKEAFDTIPAINENQKLTKEIRIQQAKNGEIFKRDFSKGQMSRDMTLFVDDDETAYHITASEENQTLLVSKLSDDYTKLTGEYIRIFPGDRNEAPTIFKSKNKYFMFTSGLTGWAPNAAKLAEADALFGNWKYLGNPCRGTLEEKNTTFKSQSTYVIPVKGKKDAFIFAADRWDANELSNSRYIWLPIQFDNGIPFIAWKPSWSLKDFDEMNQ